MEGVIFNSVVLIVSFVLSWRFGIFKWDRLTVSTRIMVGCILILSILMLPLLNLVEYIFYCLLAFNAVCDNIMEQIFLLPTILVAIMVGVYVVLTDNFIAGLVVAVIGVIFILLAALMRAFAVADGFVMLIACELALCRGVPVLDYFIALFLVATISFVLVFAIRNLLLWLRKKENIKHGAMMPFILIGYVSCCLYF